jgi:hypothetical protein
MIPLTKNIHPKWIFRQNASLSLVCSLKLSSCVGTEVAVEWDKTAAMISDNA